MGAKGAQGDFWGDNSVLEHWVVVTVTELGKFTRNHLIVLHIAGKLHAM